MMSSGRIVLIALVSLLCLLSHVNSQDAKSFIYSPSAITNMCNRDSVLVTFLVDGSIPFSPYYTSALAHVQNIATGVLNLPGYAVNLAVYGTTITSYSVVSTPSTFATYTNAAMLLPHSAGNNAAVNAINTAVSAFTNSYYSYTRRIVYLVTSSNATDYANWITVHKSVEAAGVEVFVEAIGFTPYQATYTNLASLVSANVTSHFLNTDNTFNTVRRAVTSIRRDIGGTCSIFSGTNVITYDGKTYTPSSKGYSVLTQTLFSHSPIDSSTRTFTVVANAAVNDIIITTNADTVQFTWSNGELATILNGEQITLGTGTNNVGDTAIYVGLSQLSAGTLGMVINVTNVQGDNVQLGFFDNPYVLIQPNTDLMGNLVGLCGTWDNCASNEFIGPTVTNTFVQSWSVPSASYNTILWGDAGSGSYVYQFPTPPTGSLADNFPITTSCSGVHGYLLKACSYDVGQIGAGASAIYRSIQASTCESYCSSGVLAASYIASTDCDQYCFVNYPPFDLHNVTSTPMNVYGVQTTTKQEKYVQFYLGGTYVVQATDPAGIVDYTSVQVNCSSDLSVDAGNSVTVTRSPTLGFPSVQLQGSLPQANRPILLAWKPVSYPYVGQDDNTTSAAVIAAQAPIILSGTSLNPVFTPTLPGVYVFTVAAYDGCLVRYSNVSVTAVCDACLFSARVEPTPTVFWNDNDGAFDEAVYESNIYSAPLYPTPPAVWNVSDFVPYNPRNEYLTWSYFGGNQYQVLLTTGTSGHAVINTSTLPVQVSALATFNDDVQPYYANPITRTTHIVSEPTPAVIEKAYHHELDYVVVTQSQNTLATPIETLSVVPVCDVFLYQDDFAAAVVFEPTVDGVADYCTGSYVITYDAEDVCHYSGDSFITQVNCNSRPTANSPGCKNKTLQIYDPVQGWVTGVLDGVTWGTANMRGDYTYSWTQISRPALSAVTTTCNTPTCAITPDQAGDYIYLYTVSDGCRSDQETFIFTAKCQQPRTIGQVVTPNYIFYNGLGNQTITFNGNSTAALNAVSQTVITPPAGIAALPPFNQQYQPIVYGDSGSFLPTYKGFWGITYSFVDDCGILNTTTSVVTMSCDQIITSVAVIEPSTTTVETSQGAFPAITFDGSQSDIESAYYSTVNTQYYWYWRPAGSSSVNDYTAITQNTPTIQWAPPTAGRFEILLIYTDGCEYPSTSVIVTAVCDQAVPSFVIDQYLLDGTKITGSGFQFYGPSTVLYLNATASQNVSLLYWNVTALNGDFYSYNTYAIGDNTDIYTPLTLYYPNIGRSGFSVQLTAISACPGAIPQTAPVQSIQPTCNQDITNKGANNNFLQGVTFTSDVTSVGFKQSNRFSSVTFTANSVVPSLVYYTKFLVTAAPANSIYAPAVSTDVFNQYSTTYTYGPLNNTGFSGNYQIAKTTTTTTTTYVWVWIALKEVAGNSTYQVCFTPDLPGTYTISAEIRDLCNNTFTKQITVTAGCPTAINDNVQYFASGINVDHSNFRDLARITIDASNLPNPAGSDLKFRWALSAANYSFDQNFTGVYYADQQNTGLTNWYGSTVSFVLPFTTYNNSYSARYDIWDGCQIVSGFVNISVPATGHRPLFINSIAAPVPNSTAYINVQSEDSITLSSSQYTHDVQQQLRLTDCYAQLQLQVAEFRPFTYVPLKPTPGKKLSKGAIAGIVIGSVAGAAIIAAIVVVVIKMRGKPV